MSELIDNNKFRQEKLKELIKSQMCIRDSHYTIFAGKCKYANDFAGKGGILFEKPCLLTRSLHNVASFRQNIYKGGYAMNEKNQKREMCIRDSSKSVS